MVMGDFNNAFDSVNTQVLTIYNLIGDLGPVKNQLLQQNVARACQEYLVLEKGLSRKCSVMVLLRYLVSL